MKIFKNTRIIELLLVTLLNLPNSAQQGLFLDAQFHYINVTPYGQSVNNGVFQHTHPFHALSQPDQHYVGHFSREIATYQGGSRDVWLRDCFLRLFQAEINSLDRKHVTPQLVYDRLSPYIPEPDRSKITFSVYQQAMDQENLWIDPSLNGRVKMVRNRWNYLESREKQIAANPRIRKQRKQGKGHYIYHWALHRVTESKLEIPYVDQSNMIFMRDELLREFLVEFQYYLNMKLPRSLNKKAINDNDPARLAAFPYYKQEFHSWRGVHLDDLEMYWDWMEVMNKRGRNHWDRLPLGPELRGIKGSYAWLDEYLTNLENYPMTISWSLTGLDSDLLPPGAELDDPYVPELSITSGDELDDPYVPAFSMTAGDQSHDTSFPVSTAGDIMVSEATPKSSSSAITSTVTLNWDPWRSYDDPPEPIVSLCIESR